MLSVIIPVFNENRNVEIASRVISEILENEKIDYEILFVDDGSLDSSWECIQNVASENEKIKGISFSKNFGKEAAIFAGLGQATGECAAVIDCDLQHPPEKIVEMYRLWEQGYEVVEGIKKDRGREIYTHKIASKLFYSLMSQACGRNMENTSDYKLLDRKVIDALLEIKERESFFRALSSWVGFKTVNIYYEVQDRSVGETKWSTKKLVKYAITNITSFTTIPLQIITFLGGITVLIGIVLSILTIWRYLNHDSLGGFSTVIIMQCYSQGVIMIGLGIVGYYLARIFDEVRNRPKYIIAKKTWKS